jgi:branched-chain amino acid transport system permease protein
MSTFLQLTFAGLNIGAVYALIALGWVVLYQVAKVENLAQGGFVIVGALLFITLHDTARLPLAVAVVGALLGCHLLGALLYFLVLNRFSRRGVDGPMIMTIGAAIVIGEAARMIWGIDELTAKSYLPSEPYEILGATILPHSLLLWAGTALMVVLGYLVFERTLIGKALRACADNYEGAQIVGINPRRMQFASFQLAAMFGGVGGILLVPLLSVSWAAVFPLGMIGLMGAIAGLWRYIPAALASFALGLFSSYASGYVSTAWQEVFVYGTFIAILLFLREGRQRRTVFRL